MGVPEHICKVPRPKNTIVDDNHREGPNRYAVRERAGITYVPGKNPRPRNGRIIGHIVDGKFVPSIKNSPAQADIPDTPSVLSYAPAALVKSVSDDIQEDLQAFFPLNTASTIMAVAALRVIRPGITAHRVSRHYKDTFVSVFYPGAAVSENSLSKLNETLGIDEIAENYIITSF